MSEFDLTTNCGKLPFNLSEKRMDIETINGDGFYKEKDVNEFIKIFIEKCKCNNCRDLIREIAGGKLVEWKS